MSVAQAISPVLQKKIGSLGITEKIIVESHEDQIKEVIQKLSKNWTHHIENF